MLTLNPTVFDWMDQTYGPQEPLVAKCAAAKSEADRLGVLVWRVNVCMRGNPLYFVAARSRRQALAKLRSQGLIPAGFEVIAKVVC